MQYPYYQDNRLAYSPGLFNGSQASGYQGQVELSGMFFPPEVVIETCRKMDITTLQKYLVTSRQNYNLCAEVLREKMRVLGTKRMLLWESDFKKKNYPDEVIDITGYMTGRYPTFRGLYRRDCHSPYEIIEGTNICVDAKFKQQVVEILNTV